MAVDRLNVLRHWTCPTHGLMGNDHALVNDYTCPACGAELAQREYVAVPADTLRGAVEDRDALAEHLGYAIDALEGNPWTGWSTGDARAILQRHGGQ